MFYDNPVKEEYLKMTPFKEFIITADSPHNLARKINYFKENPKQINKFVDNGYEWA